MAISEAISLVPPDPETPSTSHAHSDQGFLPSSPNPALAPSGVDHAVLDEKLDLKEEGEDDGEPDEVQKLDSIEKVEEDEAGELQKVDLKAEDEAGELQKVDLKAEDGAGELQKVEFYEGVEVPLNPTSVPSPALSDLVDWIRTLDPAVLNRIRNRDPAFLQEIQQFDPTVEIRNLAPAFPSEFSESVDVPQNPPSVPSPEPSVVEILDWIRTLGPAVLDEIQQFDPAFLDEDRSFDPSIVDGIRKLSLKEKEEKEEEEKERETEKEKENEKERENESSSSSSSGSGGGNENGGEVEKKVVEESSRRNQYPLRPEAGDCSYYPKTGNCKFGWNCTLNHPRRRKNKQVSKDKAKQREELEKKQDQTESKYYISPGRRIAAPSVAPALELNFSDLPIRLIDLKVSKDKAKQREELEEKQDQTESKYYISPGRRIGVPSVAPALELNFSDLPIRPVSKDKAKQREELEKRQDLTESKVSKDKAKQREELEELEEKQEQTESKYYISPGRRIGVPSVAPALELNFPDLPIRLVSKAKAKQREKLEEKQFQTESKVSKDEAKQREGLEDLEEKQDQTESKYYISPGRRIGVPSVAPALKLNFSDSPIRPVSKDKAKQREELEEKQEQTESKVSKVKAKQREELEEKQDQTERKVSKDKAKQREELEELEEKQEQTESKVSKDKAKQREELEELKEKQDQTESKYYISPGRRIGVPSVAAALEFNFLGLPIRPGEKDCSYYMQTASCKYETNCKFNHPDPTAAGESRPQSAYGNGRAASLQGLPNSQGINSEATEWNGYQAPAHLPHRSMPAPPPSVHRSMPAPAPPPYVMNNSVTETNYCGQYAQQTQAEEFPERPGQPVCFYFTQTGDCVNKSNCQYHHPKNQTAATPSCAPSDRGLPLRPGQNICTEYSRFGVCSSGPTCIFDHPSLSDSFL
ncbi:neurofilament heavy polypeptide isoform X3 [Pyrus x bretschneideri]|uniref:neurofilament heavy polypeptide isoform X3 n=1 Tax=Pyrus x bretschneideri TaxID=225117 RepID=UPI00202DB7B6|nr:neurofilament heavy polypeptide isoform X3 [Pyrus x bretschneideri]